VAEIKKWNPSLDKTIPIGVSLKILENSTDTKADLSAVVPEKVISDYYVEKGDSLYSIAKKHPGITISDIKKWNNIRDDKIKPGMKLKIRG
jgi:membrane-bound lytic murein transglycosylase D